MRSIWITLLLCLAWVGAGVLSPDAASAQDAAPSFAQQIRPILADNCLHCHGPDDHGRKADLRLDVEHGAFGKRPSGLPVITPGDLSKSELWRRITSDDPDYRMPHKSSKKSLTPAEIALIKKWIESGAKWEGHWAFLAPRKPELPKVKRADWDNNPIDRFILARLEAAGLSPNAEADRATLVRRVSFDLTGLPPTLKDLDRFLADKSANWYEKMVDYYLASEAYGERMTLAWMDAARYGDTSVMHADGPRDMWPWRDWVIRAYNNNMPFDQFTIEQLAGDLLPEATVYNKIASGFNRNHGTTDEGGAIAEEYRVEYAVDRVKTMGNIWLGLTVQCGQCHSHKYDPISQEEYYQLYAFFNVAADGGMQTRRGNAAPLVNVPDPQRDKQVAELESQIKAINDEAETYKKTIQPKFNAWLADAEVKAKLGDQTSVPSDMYVHLTFDEKKGNQVADAVDPKRKGKFAGKPQWADGQFGGAVRLNGNIHINLGNVGDFDRGDAFSYGCWVKPAGKVANGVPIGKMNEGNAHRGWDLYIANGQVAVHIINSWPGNALKVTTKAKVPVNKWTHVFATYDGSGKAAGVKIFFNGKEQPWAIEQNGLTGTTKTKVPLKIGRRNNSSQFNGLVDDVRIYKRLLSPAEVGALAGSDPIGPILKVAADKRTEKQNEALLTHYLQAIDKDYRKFATRRATLTGQIDGLKKSNVTCMVMQDMAKPRMTYRLVRGHYASPDKSKVIEPNTPSFLPPMPEDAPRNRLGLAQWIVAKENPLTARVTVNRYWSMFFGQGIVNTVMDFGTQGEPPTHPQLLDWLATDFVEHKWDVKRTIKQMLMSAAYRQSTRATPDKLDKDPKNRLLSRGPRFRLQGEFIRDQALAVSGLLVNKVGGPGVKPYQPPGLWNEVSLNGGLRFRRDTGEKLYRRSMYIYWRRSAPHPGMTIFDAPTREKTVVLRARTNTPLQALYTLNDEQFTEASRFFAERMMKEGGKTPASRVAHGYRLVTAHKPSPLALEVLTGLYNEELSAFRNDPERANAFLAVGEKKRDESLDAVEHAAWTIVASTILNMDAALTRF